MIEHGQVRTSLALGLLLLALLVTPSESSEDYTTLKSVEDFEDNVMKSADVWLVLVVGMSSDEIKARGIDREKCQRAIDQLAVITEEMKKLSVQVALADVEDIAGIASEFNVRKRMLPKILLFKTRARDAESIKFETFQDVDALRQEVLEILKDNPTRKVKSEDQTERIVFDKITLAVGGSEL